jgi:hypothetical protein
MAGAYEEERVRVGVDWVDVGAEAGVGVRGISVSLGGGVWVVLRNGIGGGVASESGPLLPFLMNARSVCGDLVVESGSLAPL